MSSTSQEMDDLFNIFIQYPTVKPNSEEHQAHIEEPKLDIFRDLELDLTDIDTFDAQPTNLELSKQEALTEKPESQPDPLFAELDRPIEPTDFSAYLSDTDGISLPLAAPDVLNDSQISLDISPIHQQQSPPVQQSVRNASDSETVPVIAPVLDFEAELEKALVNFLGYDRHEPHPQDPLLPDEISTSVPSLNDQLVTPEYDIFAETGAPLDNSLLPQDFQFYDPQVCNLDFDLVTDSEADQIGLGATPAISTEIRAIDRPMKRQRDDTAEEAIQSQYAHKSKRVRSEGLESPAPPKPNKRKAFIQEAASKAMACYEPLPRTPEGWNGFQYNSFGEIQGTYPAETLLGFLTRSLHNNASPSNRLQIWIQKAPADCRLRRKSEMSTTCRFKHCHMQDRRIEVGHPRLAFDELTAGNTAADPYVNAGYVHLHCAETFWDLPDLICHLNIEVDDRTFRHEKTNYCKLEPAQLLVANDFIEACRGGRLFSRSYPLIQGYPDISSRPYKGTLTHRLWLEKLKNEAPYRTEIRQQRGDRATMWHRHMGNLVKLQNARNDQAWERRLEARERRAEKKRTKEEQKRLKNVSELL